MVHITIWRLRVGRFGTSHVTFSAEKLYSGGAGDNATLAVRDRPKQGAAVDAAAKDLNSNAKRWKEVAEVLIDDVPSSNVVDDCVVLGKFGSAMCKGLSNIQTHETDNGICVSIPTGSQKKTDKAIIVFDLEKCVAVEFEEDIDY